MDKENYDGMIRQHIFMFLDFNPRTTQLSNKIFYLALFLMFAIRIKVKF